jgi:carboxyl-terminal processing protease
MSYDPNLPDPKPAGKLSGIVLVALALLFGLGMAAAGYLIGRASSGSEPAVAPPTLAAAAEAAQIADNEPAGDLPTVAVALEPTAEPSATPSPTAPPTALPTAAATMTPVPTVTVEPTAEIIPPAPEIPAPPDGSPLAGADYAVLYEVWELIAGQFDGEVPPSGEIMEAVIAGSLETLNDDYTRYVPPDTAERMRQDQDGAVEGIGALVIENDDGLFEIVRPIDGQPADLAGVQAGDVLIEVNGESVLDLSFDEVILLVRGPEGTSVNLKFLREGEAEPLEFTIVRASFEVPVVEFEILPSEIAGDATIGYIRLTEFNRNAEERLLEALEQILAQQPQGLIFDLRDNPGGFLDQSVAVADAFLPEGVALFERNIRGLDETFRTDDGDAAETIPLVVLVNSGSASASEIVAGAIQDRSRAVLVGETTFGKGSVQQIHTLADGSELRVTVARWYTPDNHTIDGEGITPDIEVESPEDLGGPEDGQLLRAVEFLLTGQ